MKVFFGFILGVLVAVALVWFLNPNARNRVAADTHQVESDTKNKMSDLGLTPDNIKDELARTGKVIRRKSEAAGHAIADATADARITAAIKAKIVADPNLSALSISVSTTDGCVTLSGTASSVDNIQRAMTLAYDTDGVTQVISTLSVKPA
jgi:osmotically-inducible protein OsmY